MLEKKQTILGIGGLYAGRVPGEVIKTFALGSCIAVVIFDLAAKSAGMVHVALPNSNIRVGLARKEPGHFADTAVPSLVNALVRSGGNANSRNWVVKLIGGASIMDTNSVFNIGGRNLSAIKTALQAYRLRATAGDVGKNFSRTVEISVGDTKVNITSPGRPAWTV